ncbi:acyl-CoA dehydrogenase [Caenispirillum bisanense]|uniref:Acyl-CoA dehydrogenase n=1 Tax=Caenispirillum bisanense TaxID=414052 RepID=A0A286GLA2_9PROT|nr:acyl-CoA dehydrogenase [Caenispirillum bisanense]SOD96290.1 Acyl-CoA dehydrogenase [Caenispirillum bisanense]
MTVYAAPVDDMRFLLHEVFDVSTALAGLPGLPEVDADLMDAVLGEAAKVCEGAVFPANAVGDREGATLTDAGVVMPAAFHDAYRQWADGAWTGIALDPAYDGQGLPRVVDFLVTEMVCGASLAFSILPGLTRGAWRAIAAHASEDLKRRWLPKMATGAWTGAMALTEPQCGTDLGLLRTRAEPAADGDGWRLTGTKMFISAADHDLTDNVVHLVLARLPDAPPGTRGISLFLVPKMLPDGRRNGWSVGSLEDKMGLHASPTCVVNYDGALGWLVGEPHRGLPAMFTMMNDERLFVGIQGIGAAECAWQSAAAYAAERLQGRAPGGPVRPDLPADPIVHHPDVARMIDTARATTEGGRALAAWVAIQLDRAEHLPPGPGRAAAEDLVALLTPVVKAAGTDFAFEACVAAQQVLGGHGYVRDWGVEQLVRDVRVTQIYEGTNGIQALDLVGRKLLPDGGRLPQRLFDLVRADLPGMPADLREPVARVLAASERVVETLQAGLSPTAAAEAATDILRLFALLSYGWMWGRMAAAAERGDGALHAAKRKTARVFARRVLPEAETLTARIAAAAA